jgi:hypothetical protein
MRIAVGGRARPVLPSRDARVAKFKIFGNPRIASEKGRFRETQGVWPTSERISPAFQNASLMRRAT